MTPTMASIVWAIRPPGRDAGHPIEDIEGKIGQPRQTMPEISDGDGRAADQKSERAR